MSVRKIPRSHTSITGRFSRGPGGGSVGFESTLERDFVRLMAFDPDVTDIEDQPVRIDYKGDNGRARHYTPDYLVQRRNAPPLLAEIKPTIFLTPDLKPKFDAARRYAAARGWVFEIWTEREIRVPSLPAIHFLLPYRHLAADPGREARLLCRIEAEGAMTVTALLNACWADNAEREASVDVLWHLVAIGKLEADLTEELNSETIVQRARRTS